MESSGECIINDAALATLGRGFCVSGVTLGSYRVRETRGPELDI